MKMMCKRFLCWAKCGVEICDGSRSANCDVLLLCMCDLHGQLILQSPKPCPHCLRKVRMSQKSETVAEKCDCRRIRRQSHFSATVSLFCDSVDRALHDYVLTFNQRRSPFDKTAFLLTCWRCQFVYCYE